MSKLSCGMENGVSKPFSNAVVRLAGDMENSMITYRYLYHILIWRYFDVFYGHQEKGLVWNIPDDISLKDIFADEDWIPNNICDVNEELFHHALASYGWCWVKVQLDPGLPVWEVSLIRQIAAHLDWEQAQREVRKLMHFKEVIKEAQCLEFGNYVLMLSNREIGWYQKFVKRERKWVSSYCRQENKRLQQLIKVLAEPCYRQFSVHAKLIDEEYVVALSMGREVEHFVDYDTLNHNWVTTAYVVHEMISLIQKSWKQEEQNWT